jgi:hypothetical protein
MPARQATPLVPRPCPCSAASRRLPGPAMQPEYRRGSSACGHPCPSGRRRRRRRRRCARARQSPQHRGPHRHCRHSARHSHRHGTAAAQAWAAGQAAPDTPQHVSENGQHIIGAQREQTWGLRAVPIRSCMLYRVSRSSRGENGARASSSDRKTYSCASTPSRISTRLRDRDEKTQ